MPLGASFLTELRMCLMNFCDFNEPKQENNQLPFKWVSNTLRITWPEEESCLGLWVTTWIQYWFYKVRLTTSRRSVASYIISSAWKMSSIIYKPYSSYLTECLGDNCDIKSHYSSHALEVFILFFNLTVRTEKAKRVKRFYSLLCLLLRLTNRITDKWTVGYLSVHVFSTKVLMYVSYWRWNVHFMRSSKPRKGLDICSRAKAVFLSHIKTLSMVRPLRNSARDLPLKLSKRLSDWVA